MADGFDIEIFSNVDWSLTVTWTDSGGSPVDLSAHTAALTIKEHATSAVALLGLTSGAGEIAVNGPLGQMVITITAAQAAAISSPRGVYDLIITDGGTGQIDRVLGGNAVITQGVT